MKRAPPSSYADVDNFTAKSWWRDPGLRKGMFHISVLYTTLYTLGYDASLLNGLQAISSWQTFFHRPAGIHLGLISASYFFPKLIIVFIIPPITDRFGRRIPLFLSAFFNLAGAIVAGSAKNTGQLIAGRILVGVGTSFGYVAATALIPELAHPRLRHRAGSFYFTTFFIGSILAAWITFGMVFYPDKASNNSWRIPAYLQGFGPALLGVGAFFVPQSPRWLISRGRETEAHKILAEYHADGRMDDDLVALELREIKASIELDRLAESGSWSTFWRTPADRRRLWVVFIVGLSSQWAGNGVINYYLVPILKQVGITKPAQTAGLNGGLSIWAWLCAMTGAYLVERVGRRRLFLISLVGMFSVFICMTGLAGSYASTKRPSMGKAVVPFIFIFQTFYSIAFTPLPNLYIPEIHPLAMRAKATAAMLFFQTIAAVFNQLVNPIALAHLGYKYYAVYAALLAVYFVCFYFTIRETRGLTTEQAAMIYDSPRAETAAVEGEEKLKGTIEHVEVSAKLEDEEFHR